MKRIPSLRFMGIFLLLLLLLTGCATAVPRPAKYTPATAMITVSAPVQIADDEEMTSLQAAIDTSIRYYMRVAGREAYCFRNTGFDKHSADSPLAVRIVHIEGTHLRQILPDNVHGTNPDDLLLRFIIIHKEITQTSVDIHQRARQHFPFARRVVDHFMDDFDIPYFRFSQHRFLPFMMIVLAK